MKLSLLFVVIGWAFTAHGTVLGELDLKFLNKEAFVTDGKQKVDLMMEQQHHEHSFSLAGGQNQNVSFLPNPRLLLSKYFFMADSLLDPKNALKYDEFTTVQTLMQSEKINTWVKPVAAQIKVPDNRPAPKTVPCGLAEDRLVPEDDLSFPVPSKLESMALTALNRKTPFPNSAKECGTFAKPEMGEPCDTKCYGGF